MFRNRIGKIVKGERRITADTAAELEMCFGLDASFWLGLQNDYDLLEEKRAKEGQPLLIKVYELPTYKTNESEKKNNPANRMAGSQRKKTKIRKTELKH